MSDALRCQYCNGVGTRCLRVRASQVAAERYSLRAGKFKSLSRNLLRKEFAFAGKDKRLRRRQSSKHRIQSTVEERSLAGRRPFRQLNALVWGAAFQVGAKHA